MRLVSLAVCVWLAAKAKAMRNPVFLACAGIAIIMAYLSTGRRSSPIYAIVVFGIIWVMRNKRFPYTAALVILILSFLFIGVGSAFRVAQWQADGNLDLTFIYDLSVFDVVERSSTELQTRSGERSSLYAILASVPHDVPLLMGQSYVNWFGLFIPRFIWQSKPPGIGRMAGSIFFGVNAGVPPGAVGEAYWNFHLMGVVVVFFLFGMFLSWMGRMYQAYAGYPAMIVLYVNTVYYFSPFQTSFKNWVFAMIPAVIVLFLCGLIRSPVRR